MISQCSFHLKGTGWYVTDYKKPVDTVGGGKRKEKEESAEAKTETVAETKAEPKTEIKAETKSAQQTGG